MKVFFKDETWIFDSGKILGKRVRLKFVSQEQANEYKRRAGDMRKKSGEKLLAAWLAINDVEMAQIVGLRKQITDLGLPVDWRIIQKVTLSYQKSVVLGGVIGNAKAEYIAMKRTVGLAKDYVDRIDRELGMFVLAHAGKAVAAIEQRDITEFVNGLEVGDLTWNNRIRDLSAFFTYCVKRKWCTADPTALIQRKKIVAEEVEIFELLELAVFWVSEKTPQWGLTPYLSFGVWGTPRCAEGFRLDWANVDVEERDLVVEQAASKPNQRRVSEELPEVLFDWIGPHERESGPLCPPESTGEWRRKQYLVPAVQKISPGLDSTRSWARNRTSSTFPSMRRARTMYSRSHFKQRDGPLP